MSLGVGDRVVYASHGIGCVEATRSGEGDISGSITLVFESGLRVTLPTDRAAEALRPLSGTSELDDVRRTLRTDAPPTTEPWSRRHRSTQEKLAAGRVTGLAEVVRDGVLREHRLGVAESARRTAPSERELYLRARKLLAAEIAACRGIDAADADAWIVEQVGGAPTEA